MPSITARTCAFGFALGLTAALGDTVLGAFAFGAVVEAPFLTECSGLITGSAALEELCPRPSSMNPPARASRAAKPAAARIRTRGLRLTPFLSAFRAARLTGKRKGAVSRALSWSCRRSDQQAPETMSAAGPFFL